MNETLQSTIFNFLCDDEGIGNEVIELVLAACKGRGALIARLGGSGKPPKQTDQDDANNPIRPRNAAYLKSITVEGFRGVGLESSLHVKPGPGITLVLGRNGSGKSSFAEGLEFLLTGENKRWQDRTSIWKEGWRNLHHQGKGRIAAEFSLESIAGGACVTKSWGDSEDLKSVGETVVQPHGQPKCSLDGLGWDADIESYRPFLSYSELGNLLDTPTKMYDAISSVLGLAELVETRELLAEQRKDREKFEKTVKAKLEPLLEKLGELDDARAEACLKALSIKRKYDLEILEAHLSAEDGSVASGLDRLRTLAALRAPASEDVEACVTKLRQLESRHQAMLASQIGRSAQLADLLRAALVYHEACGDGPCPVCNSPAAMAESWRLATEAELLNLDQQTKASAALNAELTLTIQKARHLIRREPDNLSDSTVDTGPLKLAWATWEAGLTLVEPVELADHLESIYLLFAEAIEKVSRAAKEELKAREDRWRPLAAGLHVWLKDARQLEGFKAQAKLLKSAENWMKEAEDRIRTKRFEPISESAKQNWELLRQDSNVELSAVTLKGTGTKRSVALEVNVDGTEGAALGVMSQGELNSLALSLFLPRATLEDSPFRFVIIDDPVQAMDPAKVDGLARVLEKAATNRQVVVFTHDDRLFSAVRRLGIPATAIEVTRRAGSVVSTRETLGPAQRAINDALAVAKTPEVGNVVAGRVVPGFCRAAVEAILTEAVRRRRLEKGHTHQEVERAIDDASSLRKLLALHFWDDVERGGDVKQRLGQLGNHHVRTFNSLNEGSHGNFSGNAMQLVKDTESLIRDIVSQ